MSATTAEFSKISDRRTTISKRMMNSFRRHRRNQDKRKDTAKLWAWESPITFQFVHFLKFIIIYSAQSAWKIDDAMHRHESLPGNGKANSRLSKMLCARMYVSYVYLIFTISWWQRAACCDYIYAVKRHWRHPDQIYSCSYERHSSLKCLSNRLVSSTESG